MTIISSVTAAKSVRRRIALPTRLIIVEGQMNDQRRSSRRALTLCRYIEAFPPRHPLKLLVERVTWTLRYRAMRDP